jgi:adenylosuccinate lyase
MSISAITPIDGRYASKTKALVPFFSEKALIKYRIRVEVEYFIALAELALPQLPPFSESLKTKLRAIYERFSDADAEKVKAFERETNHDVKAVEYFVKEKIQGGEAEKYGEFIHFGLTSQDINNTAIPLSVKECLSEVYFPEIKNIIRKIEELAENWKEVPMLSRTHGQPASPTRLGKEMYVFVERLQKQVANLENIEIAGKFGGATGNFNAHHIAYPTTNWVLFANNFLKDRLGLTRQQTTTQVEHYDELGALFDNMRRINTILVDFSRDVWAYISMDYFKQAIKAGEVGSSAMPHKVNPIDFENAEGNLGLANALLSHLSGKLPISRLQRDLTDSTVLRNLSLPFGYFLIANASLTKGIDKLKLNEAAIKNDLENNWSVVAEAIQTILRREGFDKPYEALRDLTRTNEKMNEKAIHRFVDTLDVSEKVKKELRDISPYNYLGLAHK